MIYVFDMGGRRKRTIGKPQRKTRSVQGRCPKCTTIVRFNVTGPVGKEIYECVGCTTKFPIDEL
jgi:hypothetical protein